MTYFTDSLLFLGTLTGAQQSCPPPWWLWPALGLLLLPWLLVLFFKLKVRVTFNTGTGKKPFIQEYNRGQTIVQPETFLREGFEVEGWYRSRKFRKGEKWNFSDKVRSSMTLYAKWVSPDSESSDGTDDFDF